MSDKIQAKLRKESLPKPVASEWARLASRGIDKEVKPNSYTRTGYLGPSNNLIVCTRAPKR